MTPPIAGPGRFSGLAGADGRRNLRERTARDMKRLIASAVLALLSAVLGAVDIGGEFTMGSMGFPWEQAAPTPADAAAFTPPSFLYGGSASIKQSISEGLTLQTAYFLDPLQRSKFQALVNYDTGVLHIGIGPVFGLFNSLSYPMQAGFASSVKFEIPGAIFLSFRNDSSIGPSLSSIGESSQGFSEISVGWYVKNAICTASMSTASFKARREADLVVSDTSADYSFLVDIFKKNQPYNIHVSLGYRTYSKEFVGSAGSTKDSLGIVVLGTELILRPARFLELALGLDSGVYTFGFANLEGRGPNLSSAFLFSANAGFTVDTDRISSRQAAVISRDEDAVSE